MINITRIINIMSLKAGFASWAEWRHQNPNADIRSKEARQRREEKKQARFEEHIRKRYGS